MRQWLTECFLLFLVFLVRSRRAGVKTTIIYPATENHIIKHSTQEVFIFDETPADYAAKTLPYIEAEQFSLDVSAMFGWLCCS